MNSAQWAVNILTDAVCHSKIVETSNSATSIIEEKKKKEIKFDCAQHPTM